MCGRNSLFTPRSVLEERFDATAGDPIRPRYTIEPVEVDEQAGLDEFGS